MLRTICLALAAVAGLCLPATAQTFTLPELGLQSSGSCRQLAARDRTNSAMVALGCLDTAAHGWKLTPNVLQLLGSGSTGDVSGMSTTPSIAGGVARTHADRFADAPTLADFGGSPSATPAANCTALAAAAIYGKQVRLVEGTYQVNCTSRPVNLAGAGAQRTVVMNMTANLPTFKITYGDPATRITDMTLDRAVTATSGGDGLQMDGATDAYVGHIYSQNNWNGFVFGITAFSVLDTIIAQYNKNDGVHFETNKAGFQQQPLQWNFAGRSQAIYNTRDGFNATSVPDGSTQNVILGQWDNLFTAGNGRDGVHVQGASNLTIVDLRLNNYFIGGDAGNGIYLDTYGGQHTIGSGFIELEGGAGIYLTANNSKVTIKSDYINGSGTQNIYSLASQVDITGVKAANPGQKTSAINIYLNGPDTTLYGGSTLGGTYGAYFDTAAVRGSITGTSIKSATTSPGLLAQTDTIIRGVRGTATVQDKN